MKIYLRATIFLLIMLFVIFIILPTSVFASSIFSSIDIDDLNFSSINKNKVDDFKHTIETLGQSISSTSDNTDVSKVTIDAKNIINFYDELTKVVPSNEISNFIDDNKEVFIKAGLNQNVLDSISTLFRTFNSDALIDIAQNDLDLDKILKFDENGFTVDDILSSVIKNTSTSTKINITLKLLFNNNFFRMAFALLIAASIYSVYITSLIFKKAGKAPYITLIPIYRDMVHLKLCNFAPWLIILLLIPFLGWLALMAIAVVGRFELSKNFGHGFFFGLGLLFLPIIFRTYLALSKDEFIVKE